MDHLHLFLCGFATLQPASNLSFSYDFQKQVIHAFLLIRNLLDDHELKYIVHPI
jgi:hypothetical protein